MSYELDPQAKFLMEKAAESGRPELYTLDVESARTLFNEMVEAVVPDAPAIGAVSDRTIPGPGGDIPIRCYRPQGADDGALPTLVFYHGGGWVLGSIDTHDSVCRWLAARAGIMVVSVDYRMGPEHKFPAAVDDAFAALEWVAASGADIGADASRIAVGGDSAGGNLAAVVTHLARDGGGPALGYQVLIYPATDFTFSRPSHVDLAEGFRLTKAMMDWFTGHYLNSDDERTDPRASPLFQENLGDLPPALVITAGFDPLRDEGDEYAAKLADAGVAVQHEQYTGQIHGFAHMGKWIHEGNAALDQIGDALKAALHGASQSAAAE